MLDINGNLKWLEETRAVVCGQQKYKKSLRHGLLADSTSSIKVSVWGELIGKVEEDVTYLFKNITIENCYGLRINTTSKTTLLKQKKQIDIEWSKYNISPETSTLCANILSVKFNLYLECINCSCKRKVNVFPGEKKTTCDSSKRKMLVSNLKINLNVEIHLSDKDDNQKEFILTAFTNSLKNALDLDNKEEEEEIEDMLLELKNVDITYNKKNIIVSVSAHSV